MKFFDNICSVHLIRTAFKQNKDIRTIVANLGYLSILQLASYAFPFVTMPYLAKVIGVEGFGKIAFASALMLWFVTIADWGFNYTATRDVAKNRDNKEKISEIFSNIFWARILLMMVSFLLLSLCILLIPKFRDDMVVILISFLMIPGHIMFPEWFFQAMERMKYITIFNVFSKTLFTVAVFLFIKEKSDYILQPLFTSLGFMLSGVAAMYYILYKWEIKLRLVPIRNVVVTIKSSTDVFINNIIPNFYNSLSTILVGFVGGDVANGIMDSGRKFINLAIQLVKISSRVFFPFLARRGDKHKTYSRIVLSIVLLFTLLLFVLAPMLMRMFFTSEFYGGGVLVMRIMSLYVFAIAVNDVYGVNYMIANGFDKQIRRITIFVSILGICLSIILVYYFTYIGAAISITISGCLRGVWIYLWVKHNKTINI